MSTSVPPDHEILARFAQIVGASLRVDPDGVTPAISLVDLGAESIDVLEIAMEVESEFSILLPERSILDIGGEVLGPDVLVADGRLTDEGRRFLAERMPEIEADTLPAGLPVADVLRLFQRVDVWVRLIRDILERSPRSCTACGDGLVQGTPGRLRCPRCATVYDLPGGDDLGRDWVHRYAAARGLPARER
jgi:acyl carrier protein